MDKRKKQEFLGGNYALLPILFVICIVPLIMRVYAYNTGLAGYAWYSTNDQAVDIFLYYKGIALILAAVAMVSILAYYLHKELKNGWKNSSLYEAKWIIPLAIFALCAFLSTIFSEYRNYGFNGITEQFESIWVVLSYCVVLVYTYYFVRTKADINAIEKGLIFLLVVLGILGVTQLVGHDFWETDLGKSIYVPAQFEAVKDSLSFNFSQTANHQVYLTLYNPNYVGVFVGLMLPITVMLCVGNKDVKKKVLWAVLSVVVFLCGLGCGSKAFLISIVITAVLGAILYGGKKVKRIPVIFAGCVVFVVVLFGYMNYRNIDIIRYVKKAVVPQENNYNIKDFIVHEDCVELIYNDITIYMQFEEQNSGMFFVAKDGQGNFLETIMYGSIIHFTDERLSDITVSLYAGYDEYLYVGEVNILGKKLAFTKGNEGYSYMTPNYRPDEIVDAETAVFGNYDNLYSGRGYIWARTIPLLKENIILGTGADSFVLEFPQDDYVAKTNAGYGAKIVTKPHNMYLQMGVQYGCVALAAFLVLAVMYAVQTLKLCWKSRFEDVYSCLALGIFLGIVGYGIMGISNDSCVALAPIAWVLLGFGFAVNRLLKEECNYNN